MAGQDLLPQAEQALRESESSVRREAQMAFLLRSLALSNIQLVTEMRAVHDQVRQVWETIELNLLPEMRVVVEDVRQVRETLEIQAAGGLGGI